MNPEIARLLSESNGIDALIIRRCGHGFNATFGGLRPLTHGYGATIEDAIQDLADNLAMQGVIRTDGSITFTPEREEGPS